MVRFEELQCRLGRLGHWAARARIAQATIPGNTDAQCSHIFSGDRALAGPVKMAPDGRLAKTGAPVLAGLRGSAVPGGAWAGGLPERA